MLARVVIRGNIIRNYLKSSIVTWRKILFMNKKYRFHLLGLAHLPVSEKYPSCAFTQKVVKFSKMMMSLGHEVFIYGAEGSDAPCTKFYQTHTLEDIRKQWGEGDDRFEIGYNFEEKENFKFSASGEESVVQKMYKIASKAINYTKKEDDFLVVTM